MMFSVFIHPVFLFSYSTMSNYLDQKLTARCAGWVEQRLRPRLARICRAPPPTQRCGLWAGPRPSAGVITWCWDSRTGFYRWFSTQMTKKTTVIAVKPHNVRLIKICAIMLA